MAQTDQHDLYFAYGSNLSLEDFDAFCRRRGFPSDCLRFVGPAVLHDNGLVFDRHSVGRGGGVLNIASRRGRRVEGVLFAPTEEGWTALNLKEGHPNHYRREQVVVLKPDGSEASAITYRAPRTADFVEPTDAYLDICRRGREDFGLDPRAIDRAARLTESGAVFVCGDLMRGRPEWHAIGDLEMECCLLANAYGTLRDHGARPAFVPGKPSNDLVMGEYIVFRDIEQALETIDAVEGFYGIGDPRNRCERITLDVDVGGRGRPCFAYMSEELTAPIIAGGDWRVHRGLPWEVLIRQVIKAHQLVQPDLIDRLAFVPDGPFGTMLQPGQSVEILLQEMAAGRICELHLLKASDDWAVRLLPMSF